MAGERNMAAGGGREAAKIVVGVHGTAASDAALDWAAREARLHGTRLHLVHARDPGAFQRAPYARADARDDSSAGTLIRAADRIAPILPEGRVTTELGDGLPARMLAGSAAGAALLVLGAARSPGAPADVLGPVVRACLRLSPCPVVIVSAGDRPAALVPEARAAEELAGSPALRPRGGQLGERVPRAAISSSWPDTQSCTSCAATYPAMSAMACRLASGRRASACSIR